MHFIDWITYLLPWVLIVAAILGIILRQQLKMFLRSLIPKRTLQARAVTAMQEATQAYDVLNQALYAQMELPSSSLEEAHFTEAVEGVALTAQQLTEELGRTSRELDPNDTHHSKLEFIQMEETYSRIARQAVDTQQLLERAQTGLRSLPEPK